MCFVTRKTNSILGYIRQSTASRSREVILALYSAHLDSWVQFWVSQYQRDTDTLEKVTQRDTKINDGTGAHLSCEKRLKSWGCSAWRKLRGISPMSTNTWRKGAKRTESGTSHWCPVPGPEAMRTTGTQKIPSEYQEALLCCVRDRALTQAAQRLCSILLGDLQQPLGYVPRPLVLAVPAGTEAELNGPRRPCPLQSFLDSVTFSRRDWLCIGNCVDL